MNVDISILGDKDLERKLSRIADKGQRKVVRAAMRKAATRARKRIVQNIQREGLIDTGRMMQAFKKTKIASASNNRNMIRIGPRLPTRSELGIDADAKGYYPTALEFGYALRPATPFIRPAIDDHKDDEIKAIGSDIGKGIEREVRR
jgi:HK97 gp10 family phage protein